MLIMLVSLSTESITVLKSSIFRTALEDGKYFNNIQDSMKQNKLHNLEPAAITNPPSFLNLRTDYRPLWDTISVMNRL